MTGPLANVNANISYNAIFNVTYRQEELALGSWLSDYLIISDNRIIDEGTFDEGTFNPLVI